MNFEFLAQIVLIFSLAGIIIIIFRKIPALVALPEVLSQKKTPISLRMREKIRQFNPFKNFSSDLFLQKLLSKIRILTLKTENKTFSWLQKLREKTQKKKLEDNYWEEIKKDKNGPT